MKKRPKFSWSIITFQELEAWRAQNALPKRLVAFYLGHTNSTWHNWQRGATIPTRASQRRMRSLVSGPPPAELVEMRSARGRPTTALRHHVHDVPGIRAAAASIVCEYQKKNTIDQDELVGLVGRVVQALAGVS